ncbi:MAG TPA: AP2 domain-containing protein [Rhizomicrobium sp.]|nr:AP2 domain-containing protein [Rhizomicrobium sp.]
MSPYASPPRPITGLQNIVRETPSSKNAGGWKVSVQRRGRRKSKSFADSKYGGKAKALAAAKNYRDFVLATVSNAAYQRWLRDNKHAPNTSGIIGVARYRIHSHKKMVAVWDAFWGDIDGTRHRRRFYVSAYGEKGAKARACAARRDAMKELGRR